MVSSNLFDPINLRNTINKYRNLSKHFFKSREKVDLCNLLIKSIDLSRSMNKKCLLIYKISRRHDLNVKTMKEWMKLYQLGESLKCGYCKSSFSNSPLDLISTIIVKKAIDNNTLTEDLISQQEFTRLRRIQAGKVLRRKRVVHITTIINRLK